MTRGTGANTGHPLLSSRLVSDIHPRYSRQAMFTGIGADGQRHLADAHVVCIGCGALGSVTANTLARAGVGQLTIVDRDVVEESNLQRQVLYDEDDVREGLPKAVAAERRLSRINSQITVRGVVADVHHANVESLIAGADLVLDGADNFETRFLVNDACVKQGIPWIYGACIGSYGLSMVVIPHETPCLRCVVEGTPPPGLTPTCDTSGVIGPVVNMIASIQSAEALKLLTRQPHLVNRDLVTVDVWDARVQRLKVRALRDLGECPCCSLHQFEHLAATHASQTSTLCGRNSVQISFPAGQPVDFEVVERRLAAVGPVQRNAFLLRCTIAPYEVTLFRDGRAIIEGTREPSVARGVYAKYIGL